MANAPIEVLRNRLVLRLYCLQHCTEAQALTRCAHCFALDHVRARPPRKSLAALVVEQRSRHKPLDRGAWNRRSVAAQRVAVVGWRLAEHGVCRADSHFLEVEADNAFPTDADSF